MMKLLITLLLTGIAAFIVLRLLVAYTSGTPAASGVISGALSDTGVAGLGACKDTPNCVSSADTREKFAIDPITFSGTNSMTIADIHTQLSSLPHVTIVTHNTEYLHATFKTGVMGYIDDVEFHRNAEAEQIDIRSASRIGKSDLGANRKRLEALRLTLTP